MFGTSEMSLPLIFLMTLKFCKFYIYYVGIGVPQYYYGFSVDTF